MVTVTTEEAVARKQKPTKGSSPEVSKAPRKHETVASVLHVRRTELQLTQKEVAVALDIKTSEFVSMVESGHRNLDLNKIPRLAAVLKVDVQELCQIALLEAAPQFAVALLGNKIQTGIPSTVNQPKNVKVELTAQQQEYMLKLYNLTSPLRYTVLSLIDQFTALLRSGPGRVRRDTYQGDITDVHNTEATS
jgi:transcriptional regulator with XRE-family HTH domain